MTPETKARPSHRVRLTAIVTLAFSVILAVLFFLASQSYTSIAESSADVQLKTVLKAVTTAVNAGSTDNSLEEVSDSPLGLSVSVFDSQGSEIRSVGPLRLLPQQNSGVTTIHGVAVRFVSGTADQMTIVVGRNWSDHLQEKFWLNIVLFMIWVPLVAIVAGITWISAARTFRPLMEMTDEARQLSGSGADARLAVPDDAEFGTLALRLNEFLDRLQAAVESQERFVADAAHELRTPLTILRGQVETALLRERSPHDYERVLHLILDESIRMSGLVESLLVSSRTVSSEAPLADISSTVQEAFERWTPRFEERDVSLWAHIVPAVAPILNKELDMILDNLLGNALWHSPAGSECVVELGRNDDGVKVRVLDQGSGIPDHLKSDVFERFYRTDSGRNRSEGGFGIGLAICKRIAEQRGAVIEVTDNKPQGSVFTVTWSLLIE